MLVRFVTLQLFSSNLKVCDYWQNWEVQGYQLLRGIIGRETNSPDEEQVKMNF